MNWSYTPQPFPLSSHCKHFSLENHSKFQVFCALATHNLCLVPCDKCCPFLHHNLVCVDRFYCACPRGPKLVQWHMDIYHLSLSMVICGDEIGKKKNVDFRAWIAVPFWQPTGIFVFWILFCIPFMAALESESPGKKSVTLVGRIIHI